MHAMPRIYRSALIALTFLAYLFLGDVFAKSLIGYNSSVHGQGQVRQQAASAGTHENELRSYPAISGIGAALSITPVGPQIGKIVPNSAAARSGKLHKGDLILAISEGSRMVSLKGKPLGEVVSLIRGPVGTPVTLRIKSPENDASLLVTLTRAAIPLPGISYRGLVGKPIPDVQFTKLGKSSQVRLSQYRGEIVVLDLWASWCGTCYAPLDKMQKIARSHPTWKGRVVLLAATIDTDISAALRTVKKRHWNETTFLSLPPQDLKVMGIATIPTLLVISPGGRIVAVGDPHAMSIESLVADLLSGDPAGRGASSRTL